MISRDEYLAFWRIPPEEADAAWAAKVALDTGPRARVPMAFVQGDIHYTSPIDGRPVTNKHARKDDLARSGCIEYDPGMKQDYERRLKASDEALDKGVDTTVDRELSKMPARKLEKLQAELQSGVTADIARITPPQVSRSA